MEPRTRLSPALLAVLASLLAGCSVFIVHWEARCKPNDPNNELVRESAELTPVLDGVVHDQDSVSYCETYSHVSPDLLSSNQPMRASGVESVDALYGLISRM